MPLYLRVISFISLVVLEVHGRTYSFGGGCASMGAWTQTALNQTDTLIRVTQSLQSNPACKGIEAIIPELLKAQAALRFEGDELERSDRIESNPNEAAALVSLAASGTDQKTEIAKLAAYRLLENATFSSQVAAVSGAPVVDPSVQQATNTTTTKSGASHIKNKVRQASVAGMDMLDQAFAILPGFQQCIMGAPDQGLAFLSAMVKLTAAYTSSQESVASRMGRTISNFVSFLRNAKFANVLRQLNETEFWLSMSCLIETTTQTYCSTRDARKLLDYNIRELRIDSEKTNEDGTATIDIKNPLAGYYILTRDIPNINSWLQKVQFGISPKFTTDATFKNRVLDNVNQLIKNVNSIRGLYQERMLIYSGLPDILAKKNALLELVLMLESKLTDGRMSEDGPIMGGSASVNFFGMSLAPRLIPFFLLGIKELPEPCRPKVTNGFLNPGMTFHDWALDSGKFIPEFEDPDALARTVDLQLEKLIDGALIKASLYYQQLMIVDQINLVSESMTSQTFTVIESFQRIHQYLAGLLARIKERKGEIGLIPGIVATMKRINKVLASYNEVRKAVLAVPPAGSTDEEEKKYDLGVANAYKKVIETTYEQFNILLQRDTFLSNRLSTFIHYDYAMRIRGRSDMTQYEREVMVESGKELLGRILGVAGINPTAALNDLNSAMVVNKRNLEAVESLFKDSLYPVIEEINLASQGKATQRTLNMRSVYRMYRDTYFGRERKEDHTWQSTSLGYLYAFSTLGTFPLVRRFLYPDLYPFQISLYPVARGGDDEFGSFEQFKARLCIQTLAFNDRRFYQDVCENSVLKSAFTNTVDAPLNSTSEKTIPLDAHYDHYMQGTKATNPVTSESICSFQTYSRRNLVFWMTLDLPR